jgi:hypothetical protein
VEAQLIRKASVFPAPYGPRPTHNARHCAPQRACTPLPSEVVGDESDEAAHENVRDTDNLLSGPVGGELVKHPN